MNALARTRRAGARRSMSGTSADGIDVALVRIAWPGAKRARRSRKFRRVSLPARSSQQAILRLGEGRAVATGEISQLNFLLGELFAEAALAACRKFRVSPARISVIGSHGQTVFHQGAPAPFHGRRVASTLQIGEPSVIAARPGSPPSAIFAQRIWRRAGRRAARAFRRLSALPEHAHRARGAEYRRHRQRHGDSGGCRPRDVFAFDTGPGNMVIDALVRHFTRGRASFDRNAEMRRSGRTASRIAGRSARDKYFRRRRPRQRGASNTARNICAAARLGRSAARARGLVRTATILTALSIVDAFHRLVLPRQV